MKKLNSREIFLNERWNYRLIVEAYTVVATLNNMERETTVQGAIRSINSFRTNPKFQTKRAMIKVRDEIHEKLIYEGCVKFRTSKSVNNIICFNLIAFFL